MQTVYNRDDAKKWLLKTNHSGWLTLVDIVYNKKPKEIKIISVYQKWGVLRFDTNKEHGEFDTFLESIEEKSGSMCELCGKKANEVILDGWVSTICNFHYESYKGDKYRSI